LHLDFEKGPIHLSPLGPSILTAFSTGHLVERENHEKKENHVRPRFYRSAPLINVVTII
jgi:hypothetical protein